MADDYVMIPAKEVKEGDFVDLEGDAYADAHNEGAQYGFEFSYAIVQRVEQETPECVRIDFDHDSVGFPSDHMLKVAK